MAYRSKFFPAPTEASSEVASSGSCSHFVLHPPAFIRAIREIRGSPPQIAFCFFRDAKLPPGKLATACQTMTCDFPLPEFCISRTFLSLKQLCASVQQTL